VCVCVFVCMCVRAGQGKLPQMPPQPPQLPAAHTTPRCDCCAHCETPWYVCKSSKRNTACCSSALQCVAVCCSAAHTTPRCDCWKFAACCSEALQIVVVLRIRHRDETVAQMCMQFVKQKSLYITPFHLYIIHR